MFLVYVETKIDYHFQFDEIVKHLQLTDKPSKKIFMLGIYASVVHTRWTNDNRNVCQALAVASEP